MWDVNRKNQLRLVPSWCGQLKCCALQLTAEPPSTESPILMEPLTAIRVAVAKPLNPWPMLMDAWTWLMQAAPLTELSFVEWNGMSVLVEFHNTGDAAIRSEVQAIVEHVLSDRPGEWRVSIVGSRGKEDWEMKVEGPNGLERSYTLVGGAGEHQPVAIGNLLLKLLPLKRS